MSAALAELLRRARGPRGSLAGYLERRARAFEEDARWLLARSGLRSWESRSKLPDDWQFRVQVAEAVAAELRHAVREIGAHLDVAVDSN